MAGEGDGDRELVLPPGFRFHPTDEELITHYLRPKTVDSKFSSRVIGDVDLNRVEPWDLPWKAKMGEKEWYFFCIKDRKYPTGSRTNRATQAGYWKATGKDKEIFRGKALVGMKKTLVFYKGRAPRGEKTNWVMHEYRLESKDSLHTLSANKGEWVINRVFKKSSNGKKVHISGLYESPSSCSSAQPPLTELPSGSAAAVAEVTSGTSNSQEERETTGELSPCEGNSSYRDSVFPRVQSFLNLLVENYGAYARQHGGGYEFFPESDLSATFAYAFLPQEHPYDHPLDY